MPKTAADKKKNSAKPDSSPKSAASPSASSKAPKTAVNGDKTDKPAKAVKMEMTPWLKKQKQKLIELRDSLVDALDGVSRETMAGSEASAFGMHQADAGSDAYDRDFALSMLSKEQDALYEIEEALKRFDNGTYGTCEMSQKKIPQLRLEAIPFARYTVECQAQLEKENRGGYGRRPPVRSLFGLGGDDDDDDDDDDTGGNSNSNSSNE